MEGAPGPCQYSSAPAHRGQIPPQGKGSANHERLARNDSAFVRPSPKWTSRKVQVAQPPGRQQRTEQLGEVVPAQKRARLDDAEPNAPPSSPSLAARLRAAKAISWRGQGELPQLPWGPATKGTVLLLDLWSGYAGAAMALLALGVRVIAVAFEVNEDAVAVAAANLKDIIHGGAVENLRAEDLAAALEHRSISCIVVGGAPPAKGIPDATLRRRACRTTGLNSQSS